MDAPAHSKVLPAVVAIIVIVLVVGGVSFFYLKHKPTASTATENTAASKTDNSPTASTSTTPTTANSNGTLVSGTETITTTLQDLDSQLSTIQSDMNADDDSTPNL